MSAGQNASESIAQPTNQAGNDTIAAATGNDTIAGAAAEWAAPDFLPDHLRGKDQAETFGKVAEDWKKQRATIASNPASVALPENADGYAFQALNSLKDVFGETKDDPIIKASQAAAHKYKMTPDQMNGFINEVIGAGNTLGLFAKEPEVDYAAEITKLVPADKKNAPEAEQKVAVKARVDEVQTFFDTLLARKEIDAEMLDEVGILLESASGVRLLEFVREGITKESGIRVLGNTAQSAALTHEDLKSRIADERYRTDSPKYDARYRADTDAAYKRLFG